MDRPPPGTIKQGYLTKSPPLEKRGIKAWKKRWCIFSILGNTEEPSLKYFKNEEDSFYAPTPIKRVSLRDCYKIEVDLQHSNHKNIFSLHLPERIYYFSAPSRMEMNEWAESLCTNLRLHNPKFQRGGDRHTMPATPPVNRSNSGFEKSATLPRDNFYGTNRPLPPEMPLPPVPDNNMYSTTSRPLPPDMPLLSVPDNMYSTTVRPAFREMPPLPPAPDGMYSTTIRPLPPEMPLPPIPPSEPMSSSSSSSVYRPPPPEIPLPPVPTDEQPSPRSMSRSNSPLLRHQRAPSPYSDEVPPSLPPRQSFSPPYLDDIANRPPAPLPHAPRANRPADIGMAPPRPPARNQSNGVSSTSSPPLSLTESEDITPPTPPPRQVVPRQVVPPLSRISSRAENNIYVAS